MKKISYESWSKGFAAITLGLVIVGPVIYKAIPEITRDSQAPLGIGMGFFALFLIFFVSFYSVRRARLWHQWGKLQYWLSMHTYIGVLSVLAVFLHANWHFRMGVATSGLILLILVTISGVIGWAIYLIVPGKISAAHEVVITPEETFYQMDRLQDRVNRLEKKKIKQADGDVAEIDRELRDLEGKIEALNKVLEGEFRQEGALGWWLYVHIPLSAALIVVACVHALMTFYL